MEALSEPEIRRYLAQLAKWSLESGQLVRTVEFASFLGAIAFVDRIAEAAERQGHHPDIDIRYNKVRLALITHDAAGITLRDIELAGSIDALESTV